jgi:hypothetical protein
MTLTVSTATSTTARTFVRAPEFLVGLTERKAFTVVTTTCVVCGWRAYGTCETGASAPCAAHLATLHTCPEPGLIVTDLS